MTECEEKLISVQKRRKRFLVNVLIGNIHTDHPKRLLQQLYTSFQEEDVDVRFFVGTESGSYTKDIASKETDYDYQYAVLYDYSNYDDPDLLIVMYGTLHIYQKKVEFETFVKRFRDVPMIILEAPVEMKRGVYLISDNYKGMKEGIEHLIRFHGCRNLVFLSGPRDNTDANERLQAYYDAMKENGLPVNSSSVIYADYSEHVDRQVEDLLDRNERVDAVVSANDEMTVAVYRVLRNRGLEPGKDVYVIGFDNMEMAEFLDPPLTTVYQDTPLMGKLAAKKAMQIFRGEAVCSERIPTWFIRRASCGCEYHSGAKEQWSDEVGESPLNLVQAVETLREFQRQSWTGPLLIRELMSEADNTYHFLMKIGEEMWRLGTKSSYMFLLKEPLKVRRNGKWSLPSEIYLSMRQKGRRWEAYEFYEAPPVTYGDMEEQFFKSKHARSLMTFLLFDGKEQYGILVCEIEPKDVSFYYTVALQIGTAIRFYGMTMKQRAYQNELKAKNESLHFSANHDYLTGLMNRQGFLTALQEQIRNNRSRKLSFFIADLDHLKEINDTFGHNDGDWAIKNAAAILTEAIGYKYPVARAGGDEFFGVYLTEEFSKEAFYNRVKAGCEALNATSDKPYYLMLSIGIHEFSASENPEFVDIYKYADEELYEWKKHRLPSVIREKKE